jgi:hypothetical protein
MICLPSTKLLSFSAVFISVGLLEFYQMRNREGLCLHLSQETLIYQANQS